MKFKYLLIAAILLPTFYVSSNAQIGRDYVPYYINSEFFHKYPQFQTLPLYHRLRHNPDVPIPKDNHVAPERFLSSDGIEIINTSSMWRNAQTETWIAVNPTNPLNIIATSNDNEYLMGVDGFRMSAFVSFDGGRTWKHSPTPRNSGQWITPTGNRATVFDPGVAFDRKGNAYYVYGFSMTDGTTGEQDQEKNGVFVVKSTDGGNTWNAIQSGSPNGIMAVTQDAFSDSGNPFHDRYSIAVDINPNSPYKDNVYVSWRVFRGLDGVVFSRSTDGGESFSSYIKIAPAGQAPMPAVGPNGEVYLAWIDRGNNNVATAMFARSTNGGLTFSSPIEAQRVMSIGVLNASNGRHEMTDKYNIRVSSPPQIAVDISNSPYRGNIYLIQAGREGTGAYGIYLAKSTNSGQSWQKNIRIDNSTLRNDMYFPSISVDPVTGMIGVLYYSSQLDPTNVGVDAFVAISRDGGNTWRHVRVSPFTAYFSNANTVFPQGPTGGVYWGDYTSISVYNSRVYPLFWMSTHSSFQYYFNDLFTALISPAPKPPTNLSTNAIMEPQISIKINWQHPTHNLLGDQLGEFKINIFRGNDKIGEVQHNASPTFTDNGITLGQSYLYRLQAETKDGLTSNFAEITAIGGGNPKPMPPTDITWRPVANGIRIIWRNPSKNVEGETFNDKIKFNVYHSANAELIVSLDNNYVAGAISSAVIELPTEAFYKLRFRAVGVRTNNETVSEWANEELIAYSGAPLNSLEENFDNAGSLVPNYKTGPWGLTNAKSSSPPNSWTDSPTGNYQRNVRHDYMLAPVILSPSKTTFTFEHIALIDTITQTIDGIIYYNGGIVSWSNDFGQTWNHYWMWSAGSSKFFILNDLANSQWQLVAKDMSQYMGDTLLFRFTLITNNHFRVADGWYIDNIKVDDSPAGVNIDVITQSKIFTFPNPVVDYSSLQLDLTRTAHVTIDLYNSIGEKVAGYGSELMTQGQNFKKFDLSQLQAGMYFYRLNIDGNLKTIPISIVR